MKWVFRIGLVWLGIEMTLTGIDMLVYSLQFYLFSQRHEYIVISTTEHDIPVSPLGCGVEKSAC